MTDIEHVVNDLERKASLTREIHVYSSKKCKRWINLILILTVVLTIIIGFFALAGPYILSLDEKGTNIFGIIIAMAGFAILILSISDKIFGLNKRYVSHIQGLRLFTDFIRKCHQFRHIDLKEKGEEENRLKLEALQDEYSKLNQLLPINDISDKEFLKYKQNFYIKVEVSGKLDADPHLNINEAIKIRKTNNKKA